MQVCLTRFDTEWKSRGCSNRFLVTHKQVQTNVSDFWLFHAFNKTHIQLNVCLQTPADMKIKWKRLVRSNTICNGEETKVGWN